MHAIAPQGLSQFSPQRPIAVLKLESTLIAQFALRGHAVHRLEAGGYLVSWHNCSRHCLDLEALEAFARQVGAIR
jgi:hypothetical protein